MPRAASSPRAEFSVQTLAASPNLVLLARAIASLGVLKVSTVSTGPNICWGQNTVVQWNSSIVATIGEQNFVLYRGVALFQGLICTKRVHLGLSEVAGCPHSGVTFKRGSTIGYFGKTILSRGHPFPGVKIKMIHG